MDYVYDHRNRMTAVRFRTSGGALTKQLEYDYDAWNRLIAKRVDSNGDGTFESAERRVYDGNDVVLVFDGADALKSRHLHDPGTDAVFADEDSVGAVLWALADEQGTVRDWASYDGGTNVTTVANHLKFDAFGRVTAQSNAGHVPLYGYTGQDYDADTGLVYYSADGTGRWYDPATGEFTSEDPIGFGAGDANLGRYVGNSPTNYTDPTGLTAEASFLLPGQTLAEYEAAMLAGLATVPTTGGGGMAGGWLDRYAAGFNDLFGSGWSETAGGLIYENAPMSDATLANMKDWQLAGITTAAAIPAGIALYYGAPAVAGRLSAEVTSLPGLLPSAFAAPPGGALALVGGGMVTVPSAAQMTAAAAGTLGIVCMASSDPNLRPDIAKKLKQFDNKSLRDQERAFKTLSETYARHLKDFTERAKVGEIERMRLELEAMKRILEGRGRVIGPF